MALDLENPEVKAEVDAIREAALAEANAAVADKYAGLEKNQEQLLVDRKAASQKAKEAQELVDRYKAATKDREIDDVENTFTSIENADYKSLLGEKKFDEAYEIRAKVDRKEFAKQLEEKDKLVRDKDSEILAREERLLELELYSVGVEKFLGAKGNKDNIRDLKFRLGEDAKRNDDGNFFFPDQFGNPRKDSEGNDMTIESYINESLRAEAPSFFPEVKGSGAAGSQGAGAAHGGIKRSDLTSKQAGDFIDQHGEEAYGKLEP